MKQELTSMSMRWRVEEDVAAEFRADLARHDLKVQRLMEALMHTYTMLPDSMKTQLAEHIRDQGTENAGRWLSDRLATALAIEATGDQQ